MANTYYDATGVLVLDRVTPVITALFGGFDLDETDPGNGEAYIARISEGSDPQWDDILYSLAALSERLGVRLPEHVEPDIQSYLRVLAKHFHVEDSADLKDLIEHHSFVDAADLEALFLIAAHFNDGHGLSAIRFEGCWHCDRALLFEFGGHGIFISREFAHHVESSNARRLGTAIRASLVANDLNGVAARLASEVADLLKGIGDNGARQTVREALARHLQAHIDPARRG